MERIEVVGELEVLFTDHQRGRRFGADDRVAVSHGVRQDTKVQEREVARPVDVSGHERGHSAVALPGGNVDVDPGMPEHGDDGLGEFLVEIIGIQVDEVEDARSVIGPRCA